MVKKTKREEVELAKACKKLMRFGSNLIGPPLFKPSTPAIATPKLVQRSQTKKVNTQKRKKSTAKKGQV